MLCTASSQRCVVLTVLEDYSEVLIVSSFVSCWSKVWGFFYIVGLNMDVQINPVVLIFLVLAAARISRLMLLSCSSCRKNGFSQVVGNGLVRAVTEPSPFCSTGAGPGDPGDGRSKRATSGV